ncbi:MAG: NADH-quinone oxidoreductase subunit L [Caldilineales bacterium]|nr:NADH-quinone oxidoreductase subunit L [Caldilineales bacterium]MDW8318240.1 NADH-quinone oxidoreductase subunit L [Anaerolineae bacterium]
MLDYAWLIFVPPLAALLVNAFFGRRLGKPAAGYLGAVAVGLSFLVALGIFFGLLGLPAEERSHTVTLWSWIHIGNFRPDFALLLDPLSSLMALVVTGVGFLIHVYSVEYMKLDDEHHQLDARRYARYFVFLNFFIVAMLILVLANNLVLLYLGWEGVGLASYLLIGFWFHKPSAADAGKKAFLVNRVGDFGMAVAIMLIFAAVGAQAGSLAFTDLYRVIQQSAPLLAGVASTVTLLLLLAATGKSAQIPLWVWLPDAMEGPTPVSALIHAATMVTAGVYMTVRMSPLFELAGNTLTWVAWVGALTALMAATIALTKTDLKRILAYSTISQLGYMFLGVGVGGYVAAMFHLTTHAFFKALLFLAAGSVMHALHGELDINKMGGLRAKLPTTYRTFLIGAAALAGFPLLSGFFSKDAILVATFEHHAYLLYAIGLVTALLTAVYSFKMVFVPFWGQPRDRKLFDHAHESPALMTLPLWVLAALSVVGGLVNLPFVATLEHWLEKLVALGPVGKPEHPALAVELALLAVSALVALGGIWLAYRAYVQQPDLAVRIRERIKPLHTLAANGYYFDWAYNKLVEGLWAFSRFLAGAVDQQSIDAAVNGLARAFGWLGSRTSRLETGLVSLYALSLFVGLVVVLGYFLATAIIGR